MTNRTVVFALAIIAGLVLYLAIGGDALTAAIPFVFLGPTLTEQRTELKAKRDQLKELWDLMGPTRDAQKVLDAKKIPEAKTTQDVVDEIQRQTKAIDSMAQGIELEASREFMEKLGKAMESPSSALNVGGTYPFPGQPGKSSKYAGKTLGDLVIESKTYKEYSKAQKEGPATEFVFDDDSEKARILGVGSKAVLTETGFAPQAVRTGLILPGALRRPVVADLIPDGTTRANAIVYMEETTTTNAAAAVAEGADKPESALAFTERNSPVRKIATVLPITDELLEDEPAMRSYVEARLRLFLALAEESQLLTGSGVAPQLLGLYNVSGINTQAKGADPTPDAFFKGMDLIRTLAFLEPDSIVVHPNDWQDIRLLRTADGIYIFGSPMEQGTQRMWGVPVVVTPAATQNTGLILAAAQGMQIFRRSEVQFAISDQHSDFFIKNQLMLRVEERLALVVYRPKAICTVTGI